MTVPDVTLDVVFDSSPHLYNSASTPPPVVSHLRSSPPPQPTTDLTNIVEIYVRNSLLQCILPPVPRCHFSKTSWYQFWLASEVIPWLTCTFVYITSIVLVIICILCYRTFYLYFCLRYLRACEVKTLVCPPHTNGCGREKFTSLPFPDSISPTIWLVWFIHIFKLWWWQVLLF